MIGLPRRDGTDDGKNVKNLDVAKVMFDSFSRRLSEVEQNAASLSSEVRRLRESRDRSQISDIVLLERLEKLEGILLESLTWIRRVAEVTNSETRKRKVAMVVETGGRGTDPGPGLLEPSSVVVGPSGQAGALGSITTPTELQVLSLLGEKGSLSGPEIGRLVGRSREHSARLMKRLFEEGFVRRDQSRIPFRYSLVERVRQGFKRSETKAEEKEGAVTTSPA